MLYSKTNRLLQIPFLKKILVWLFKKYVLIMASVLPDKLYLRWRYRMLIGRKLNLNNPVLFQEKLQWIKLYDRKPI